MKVVIAVHHFPPRYAGGAELRAYRTGAWLKRHGHDVHIVCVEEIDSDERSLTFEDDSYDGLPVRRLRFNLDAAPDPFRWRYDNRWIGNHLSGYLADLAPDVVHLISGYMMSGSTLLAAEALRIPTVVSLTDFWFLCPRVTLLRSNGQLCGPPFSAATCAQCLGEERRRYRIPGRFAPGLMRAFWKRQTGQIARVQERMDYLRRALDSVRVLVSPSRFLRDLFIQAGVVPEKIVFCRQGRDFASLGPGDLAKTPSRRLRIGYMGQIAPHKGVHTLFKAVQLLPKADLEVKVFGDTTRFPDYVRRLRRMADRDSRLKLAGMYERTEISRVLRDVDVVVVPSIWYENSPNTILEAFAHRTPVVVSDLGGMSELVEDGTNGLLFESDNASSLADTLRCIAQDDGLLKRLSRGCKPVKPVAEEMNELLTIYRSLLSRTDG